MNAGERARRWASWLGWGSLVVLLISLLVAVTEQITSGFDVFRKEGFLIGLLYFVGDVVWVFAFLAPSALVGFLSLIALVWIVAYLSVRWQEARGKRSG